MMSKFLYLWFLLFDCFVYLQILFELIEIWRNNGQKPVSNKNSTRPVIGVAVKI